MELKQKNEFVVSLREHLKDKYRTNKDYTPGENDFKAQKQGGGYALVRRTPKEPRNINGFYFRKDLCSFPPKKITEILREIHNFSSRFKGIESKLEESLKLKIGKEEYLVSSYIDGGHAGEIIINFLEMPCFGINKLRQ